jgi:DNA primase
MHAEDVSFRDAVDRLTSGRSGPVRPMRRSTPAPRPSSSKLEGRTADELAVLQAATSFYHSNLLAERRALEYLAQRGISPATARQYRLGYAAGDQLLSFLHWQRLPLGAALHLGLLTRAGHEFMADRIVVPELCAGRPMWLIGRALAEDLADDVPKYLGLPGTKPLLGWDPARSSATVCAVEGVFDFLTLRQWGYPVLGLLGTNVRADQVEQLRAFSRAYLVLDTDDAGVEGTSIYRKRSVQQRSRLLCPRTSRTPPSSPCGRTARPSSPRRSFEPSPPQRRPNRPTQPPRRARSPFTRLT